MAGIRKAEALKRALAPIALAIALLAAAIPAVASADGSTRASSDSTASQPRMARLQADLRRLIAADVVGGDYAVAVTDLQTGASISVNGDEPRLSACTINLLLIMQVAKDLQDGRVTLEQVDDLVRRTVYSSNAATARELYRVIGKGSIKAGLRRVNNLIKQIGLEDTVLDHPPSYTADSLKINRNNWLTADDANTALEALWEGDLLRPQWRDYVLDHLSVVSPGLNYLTGIVPNAVVSHKNGFFPALSGTYVDNDVAIVRFAEGGQEYAYAVSLYAQGVPTKYGNVPLGQALMMTTHQFFLERYGK